MPLRNVRLNGTESSADYASVGSGDSEASEQLLYWLREQHDQYGPKYACGVSQCGACTVLVDGAAVRSCTRQMHTVPEGAEVRTLDGLAGDRPHPLQRAVVSLQAGQCGFCLAGIVMGVLAWLEERIAAGDRKVPSDDEIKAFLSGTDGREGAENYICRCGAHQRIVAAIRDAAKEMVR
ncbi:(2Fe-2S)-binding protein [Streptomyces liangshanensis]|uniref:(2Fe-2S)-binding protein n=1 Tax=Streptomyces liangshanensis TaxID=2717324 RepID=UPI001AAE7B03|nr:2Fe-2S iron-sulfur cluster-binding protein [Streptomyces liangshanensis]